MRCGYCGRFMRLADYGAEFGSEWVCSQQVDHIIADPQHWSVWIEEAHLEEWGIVTEQHIPAHTMTEREIRAHGGSAS